jgi:hypothetical protein
MAVHRLWVVEFVTVSHESASGVFSQMFTSSALKMTVHQFRKLCSFRYRAVSSKWATWVEAPCLVGLQAWAVKSAWCWTCRIR